jgi:hypothetical protein
MAHWLAKAPSSAHEHATRRSRARQPQQIGRQALDASLDQTVKQAGHALLTGSFRRLATNGGQAALYACLEAARKARLAQ